jgi:hypothetical protein
MPILRWRSSQFRTIGAILVLVLQPIQVNAASIQPLVSLASVLGNCAERTTSIGPDENGKYVEVGTFLDNYCRGILEAVAAMRLEDGVICFNNKVRPTPEDLLSVVNSYLSSITTDSDDAVAVIGAAYRRAFPCTVK